MPLPSPPVALDGICSVIFNNTLYTYSAKAFQALPLAQGAKWKQLPQGEEVTGAACVGSTPADPQKAGFYVVGGKGTNETYQGLQKFTYSTGSWESINLNDSPVTQNRLWHGAVYLNASDSILIYAGSQEGAEVPSSQTFTVGASPPYSVSSYRDALATPALDPILLPWSYTQGMFVGGSTANTGIKLFTPETSWVDGGTTLAAPLSKNLTEMKAVLVAGDDGSKSLYIFDLTVSPNSVKRVPLMDGQGVPIQNSAAVARSLGAGDSRIMGRKDDAAALTVEDWPEYNSTLAPTVARDSYAVATGSDGRVVFAGGNSEEVLCIFNARENRWENATSMLMTVTTSHSSTATATATATLMTSASAPTTSSALSTSTGTINGTNTTVAPVAQSDASKLSTNTILGISLGSIFGLAFILVFLYFCLERRRKRRANVEAAKARGSDAGSSSEKDSFVFADRGLPRGPFGGSFRGHNSQDSESSFSSMAILMGRVKHNPQQSGDVGRNPSSRTKRSSASSILSKAFKNTISKPILQEPRAMDMAVPSQPTDLYAIEDKGAPVAPDTAATKTGTLTATRAVDGQRSVRRSSGWNRYWSGGSALNILGFGSGPANGAPAAGSKRATVSSAHSSNYEDRSQFRITQDSATVPPLSLNVYAARASLSRVNSGSPTIAFPDGKLNEGMSGHIERPVSGVSDMSAYSSGIPESVHDAWDPTRLGKPWGADRAPSSVYSSVAAASTAPTVTTPKPTNQAQTTSPAPSGISRQPQLLMASTSSDMSWLNLGDQTTSRA